MQKAIIATAGSGKTHYITSIINEYISHDNGTVCAITFTNKAADELIAKIQKTNYTLVSTIHKLAITILTDNNISYNKFNYEELILKATSILKQIKTNFIYLLAIDEIQDINNTQYKFIVELKRLSDNIVIVGDPFQTIFSFQGSDTKYFKSLIDNMDIEYKSNTYRFGTSISSFLNTVYKDNNEYIKIHSDIDIESDVTKYTYDDLNERKLLIKNIIKKIEYKKIGILFKTNEEIYNFSKDNENKYNYRINLSNHPILILFKIIKNKNKINLIEFYYIMEWFGYGGWKTKQSINHLNDYLVLVDMYLISIDKLYEIVNKSNFNNTIYPIYSVDSFIKIKNTLDIVVKLLPEIDIVDIAKSYNNLINKYQIISYYNLQHNDIIDIINKVINFNESSTHMYIDNNSDIELSTVHSAKGLEYEVCIHNFITKRYNDSEKIKNEIDRLNFVGMTRAKQNLILLLPNIDVYNNYDFFKKDTVFFNIHKF